MFKYFIKSRIEKNLNKNIEKIERLLTYTGPLKIQDLVRLVDLDDRQLLAVCERAIHHGHIKYEAHHFCVRGKKEHPFFHLAYNMFNIHKSSHFQLEIYNNLYKRFEDAIKQRPLENIEWSQRHVTIRSALLRSLYMLYRGDLVDKNLVLVGDDDLASLGLMLIGGFRSLQVLEIDSRICEYIQNYSIANKIENVQVTKFDVNSSSVTNKHKYDVCISDPSKELYNSFFNLSKTLIHEEGTIYIFVNPSHNSERAEFQFQHYVINNGLMLTDLVPSFNEYYRDVEKSEDFNLDLYHLPELIDDRVRFKESLMRLKFNV